MRYLTSLSAVMLLIIGIVAGCNQTTATQQQAVNNTTKTAASPTATAAQPPVQQEAKRISLDEAKAAFDAGKAFFIDTRDADSYNTEHIKGAVNITADQIQNRLKEIPADKEIIAYCSWPNENSSARAVQILAQNKITNAAALVGGTKAWKDKGYPMKSKAQTK